MKKIFFGLFATFLIPTISFAQKNNPYNQRGLDMLTSVEIIMNDFKEGKIKDINQETLDYYSKSTPLNVNLNLETFSNVVKNVTQNKLDDVLKASNLSTFTKEILKNAISPNADIIKLVENVKNTKMALDEKEFILSSLAFIYNSNLNSQMSRQGDGLAGVLIGGAIGFPICGLPCGIGGMAIGFIYAEFFHGK